ncbi:hypothetical protein [Bacillus altitudinis]|uniref:hypothetical protein n=1 Tax=Bacillus altitudinis TaxID=293387 RepID=UPI00148ECAAF|nr:hypothetical protein [Bacillus altitudinis]NOL32124.1 hypothetical protein [Bacillus altitudinis]
MHIFYYDEEYLYVCEDVISDDDEIPKNATDVQPGFYLSKYDPQKKEWYESATQEYIDSLKPKPLPPSDIELLKQQNAVLTKQLTEISKEATAAKLREAQMAKQLAQLMTEKLKGGENS